MFYALLGDWTHVLLVLGNQLSYLTIPGNSSAFWRLSQEDSKSQTSLYGVLRPYLSKKQQQQTKPNNF